MKSKRFLAMGLAVTMVLGSSVTAFADDSGHSSTGTGSNEGHVDKRVISVTLPTVATTSTPFNYTVDLERLVPETEGARYTGITFTSDAERDGVYFLNTTAGTEDTYNEETSISDETAFNSWSSGQLYIKNSDGDFEEVGEDDSYAEVAYYTKIAGSPASSQYDNKSGALTATSQSSADVELTVEVAVGNDGSVSLVDAAPSTDGYTAAVVASAEELEAGTYYTKSGSTYTVATGAYDSEAVYYKESDPELYLALMVGDATKVLTAGETVSQTVTIEGVNDNFETKYNSTSEKYEYAVKETPDPWNSSDFYLTGVASKASAENVTVPTLTVTWSYTDPEATVESSEDEELSITLNGTYSRASTSNVFEVSGLGTATIEKVEALNSTNAVFAEIDSTMYTISGSTLTVDGTKAPWGAGAVGQTRGIKITLSNEETVQTTFVVNE